MILKIDPDERLIYIEGPVNAGDFINSLFELTGPDPEADFEWTIVPDNALMKLYQS